MRPQKNLSDLVHGKQFALGEILKTLETHDLTSQLSDKIKKSWIAVGILMLILFSWGGITTLNSQEFDLQQLVMFLIFFGLTCLWLFWIAFKSHPILLLTAQGLKFSNGPHDGEFLSWADMQIVGIFRTRLMSKSGRT